MNPGSLTAISPVDGRYHEQTAELSAYFSEQAFMKFRLQVEVEYFISLWEIPLPALKNIDKPDSEKLRSLYRNFTTLEAVKIKEKGKNYQS